MSASRAKSEATSRRSFKPFPEAISCRTPYGRRNSELGELSALEMTLIWIDSEAWETLARPHLEGLAAKRADGQLRDARGRTCEWSAEENEIVLLYGRLDGVPATDLKELRKALMADRLAREALGFAHPRKGRRGEPTNIDAFLPGEGTLRAHLRKFGEKERLAMYTLVEKTLLNEYLEQPETAQYMHSFGMDGFPARTHHKAPLFAKRKRGETGPRRQINAGRATAPDAGYMPDTRTKKGGDGWLILAVVNAEGICVDHPVGRINEELSVAERAAERFKDRITPHLDKDRVAVMTTDGLMNSNKLRGTFREAGVAENIHGVSHADTPEAKERARVFAGKRIPLVHPSRAHYSNWSVTGHRELVCKCGEGKTEVSAKKREGKLTLAVVGRCANCGTVRVKSGRWYLSKQKGKYQYRMCEPDEYERADLALGNPLTYNHWRAKAYGGKRFGGGEGFHGTLRNLGLEEKNWFRRRIQLEIDVTRTNSVLICIALEKRRRAAQAGPAPPQAVAA